MLSITSPIEYVGRLNIEPAAETYEEPIVSICLGVSMRLWWRALYVGVLKNGRSVKWIGRECYVWTSLPFGSSIRGW